MITPSWASTIVVLSMVTSLWGAAGSPATLSSGVGAGAAPFQQPIPAVEVLLKGPASSYGNLAPAECNRRLSAAAGHEAFVKVGPSNGIAAPYRVVGPILGVNFIVPPKKSPFGVLDCRQALLWLELAPILVSHGVVSVQIDNFYRNHARVRPGRKSQHAYGLAADVTAIVFGPLSEPTTSKTGAAIPDGSGRADVEDDFLGQLGQAVCGPEARIIPKSDSDVAQLARATRMRNLVCDLARRGAFHHILTPNYNQAHRNHLHLDLQRDNKWFSVQ